MKKILIISYYFSNPQDIAAVRINGLAKFMPKFGWEPYILTSKPNSIEKLIAKPNIFEALCDDKSLKWKRILGLRDNQGLKEQLGGSRKKNKLDIIDLVIKIYQEFFAYPDIISPWRKPAVEMGDQLIEMEGIDAIISSSGPPTCNLIANDLKKKHGLPWIADFRDLWTQNHYSQHTRFRRFFERRLEIKTLSRADALTTVSQPLAEKLEELHPGKRILSIPNGFDPSQKNTGLPLNKKFSITYTGALYRGRRDPEPLFQSLRNLLSKGLINPNDLSVEFYGAKEGWLEEDAKKYGLNEVIRIKGSISRQESIEKQRRSHLLLLLTWNNKDENGVYTGKIFDYLAACRPILSLGASEGVVADLLNTSGAGFHPSSQKDLEGVIMDAYNEYKLMNTVTYHGSPSEVDKFNHIEMATKFNAILDDIVD